MAGAVGFVALLHVPQTEPSGWDWLVAVVSASLVPAGGRVRCRWRWRSAWCSPCPWRCPRRSAVASRRSSRAWHWARSRCRRPGPGTWWSAAAVGAASGVSYFPLYSFAANLLIVLLDVGLPLAGGLVPALPASTGRAGRARALEAERNRDWSTKAARAAERAAVARELHDVVAHHVASIVLRVGVVRHVVGSADPRWTRRWRTCTPSAARR